MNNSIWNSMHPDFLTAGSDSYYERLASELNDKLNDIKEFEQIQHIDRINDFISKLAVGYLEDKASNFGVWDAFVSLNEERYGYKLPFFELSPEYDVDSINFEDVKFLVWMGISMSGVADDLIISPLGGAVDRLAREVYEILCKKWMDAPEALRITTFIEKCLSSTDWTKQRTLAEWLTFNCYLTSVPDMLNDILASQSPVGVVDNTHYRYAQRAISAVSTNLRPLGLKGPEYVKMMARNKGYEKGVRLWDHYRYYGMAIYKIVGSDKDSLELETVYRQANSAPLIGETMKFAISSLSEKRGIGVGRYIGCSLVEWNGLCELNGMLTSFEEKPAVDNSGGTQQLTSEMVKPMKERAEGYVDKNGGNRFAFFKTWKELYDFFEIPEPLRPKKQVKPTDEDGLTCFIGDDGSNAISFAAGRCLKCDQNPFYDEKEASSPGRIIGLFINNNNDGLSYEGALYAAHHGMLADANLISHNGEDGKKVVQEYLDYWIDFYSSLLYSDLD